MKDSVQKRDGCVKPNDKRVLNRLKPGVADMGMLRIGLKTLFSDRPVPPRVLNRSRKPSQAGLVLGDIIDVLRLRCSGGHAGERIGP